MSTPDPEAAGRTPDAPDVDQPDGGAHDGSPDPEAAGRTPAAPDVDQPDGGAHGGS